jgi:branched-chain amino acid transport system substrate-binding protein
MKKANRMITRRDIGCGDGRCARPSKPCPAANGFRCGQGGLLSDVAGPYRNVGGAGGKGRRRTDGWIDAGFNLLVDGGATSSGLAVQEIARTKKTIFLGNGPSATKFSGKFCSPYGFHFWADTYALAKGTGGA